MRSYVLPGVVLAALTLATVLLVATSLDRPAPPTFAVTPADPRPEGDSLVGPLTYTVDASNPDRWVYFDFSRGSVVGNPDASGWDLAFRRFSVITNGGAGFAGEGGAVDLRETAFDSVPIVPEAGYRETEVRSDSVQQAFDDWYDYSFTSHLLMPRERTFAVRTADGRYALLRFLGYYCPGASPGCVTFEYVYQGGGGRSMARTGPPRPRE